MGVVYGAGSLWNWILYPGEPGHKDWTIAAGAGWKEALEFKGSDYVGNVGKILRAFDTTGMVPNWNIIPPRRGLWIPEKLLVVYLSKGGKPWIPNKSVLPGNFRVYDPKTAKVISSGNLNGKTWDGLVINSGEPRILIFYSLDTLIE